MNYQVRKNEVSLCHRNNCVHANGDSAKVIAGAAAIMLLLFGLAALARASK